MLEIAGPESAESTTYYVKLYIAQRSCSGGQSLSSRTNSCLFCHRIVQRLPIGSINVLIKVTGTPMTVLKTRNMSVSCYTALANPAMMRSLWSPNKAPRTWDWRDMKQILLRCSFCSLYDAWMHMCWHGRPSCSKTGRPSHRCWRTIDHFWSFPKLYPLRDPEPDNWSVWIVRSLQLGQAKCTPMPTP